jgi:hypothetical protein
MSRLGRNPFDKKTAPKQESQVSPADFDLLLA